MGGGIGSRTDFTHIFEMFDDPNMRSGLYPFFHIAVLNDFGSFALCMSDRLFDSAHSFTASPLLLVEVYPQCVVAVEVEWRHEVKLTQYLLLLFAMIRSVVKSFKVPDVEVAAARMSNESALTRMTDSTPKKTWSDLTLVLDG